MYEIELQGLENKEILVLEKEVEENGSTDVIETIGAILSEEDKTSDETSAVVSVDDTKYQSGFEKMPQDANLLERLAYGGKVAAIGMITVFLVLVIIWALCSVMGKVIDSVSKKEKKAEEPQKTPRDAQSSATVANQVDYTTVAVVASAAIAAYRGEDTVNFNISSIRPCGNGAVALAPEVVAQIAASIACLEGKDEIDFTISSIRVI